tara:strand:- start:466 stop:708 length:243 start_codon:yes stop_codon:yes gene_type:complete
MNHHSFENKQNMWFTNGTSGGAYLTFSYCRKTITFLLMSEAVTVTVFHNMTMFFEAHSRMVDTIIVGIWFLEALVFLKLN